MADDRPRSPPQPPPERPEHQRCPVCRTRSCPGAIGEECLLPNMAPAPPLLRKLLVEEVVPILRAVADALPLNRDQARVVLEKIERCP